MISPIRPTAKTCIPITIRREDKNSEGLSLSAISLKSLLYIRPSSSIAFNESNSINRAVKIVYSKISKQKPYKYLFGELTALCVPKK